MKFLVISHIDIYFNFNSFLIVYRSSRPFQSKFDTYPLLLFYYMCFIKVINLFSFTLLQLFSFLSMLLLLISLCYLCVRIDFKKLG